MSKKSVKGKADVERKPTKENLQYKFNQAELLTIGKELGEMQIQLRQLDDDRKKAADEWKSRIYPDTNTATSIARSC